jgi:hypothetical protein
VEVDFCIGRLSSVGKDAESLGNCLAARQLIGKVWEKRVEKGFVDLNEYSALGIGMDAHGRVTDGAPGGPGCDVGWRSVMLEMNRNPLLLV